MNSACTSHVRAFFNIHNINRVENVHSGSHASRGVSSVYEETVNVGREISSITREVSLLGEWKRNRRLDIGQRKLLNNIRNKLP